MKDEHDRIRRLIKGVMNDLHEMDDIADTPESIHGEQFDSDLFSDYNTVELQIVDRAHWYF